MPFFVSPPNTKQVSDLQAAAQRNNMALHSAEEELKGIRKELQSTMLEMKNLRSNVSSSFYNCILE